MADTPTVRVLVIEAGDQNVWDENGERASSGDEVEVTEEVADSLVDKGFVTRVGRRK